MRKFAGRNIGNLYFSHFGQLSPDHPGSPIGFQRLLERSAVPAGLVDSVKNAAAELSREEPAEAALNRDVDRKPAEFRRVLAGNLRFRLRQVLRGVIREILQPLRDFNRRILSAAFAFEQFACKLVDGGKELRIKRTDISKDLGRRAVREGMSSGRIDDRLV